MAQLHISPEAKRDLHDIKEYITVELDSPSAAVNTVSKIIKAIGRLIDFPEIGAPLASIVDLPNDYRYLVSGNYLVFYRHEENKIIVVRVINGRRDYMKILFGEMPE